MISGAVFRVVLVLQSFGLAIAYHATKLQDHPAHWQELSSTNAKRRAFYPHDADTSTSVWVPLSNPVTKRSESRLVQKFEDRLRPTPKTYAKTLALSYPTLGGIVMPLYKPDEIKSLHPITRHLQRRNRVSKRWPQAAADKRDLTAGVNHTTIPRIGHRGLNNFAASQSAASTPVGTASVSEDGADVSYFSTIQVGSQKKPFLVVIDSGSSDFWIPAADCTSAPCQDHATFGPSDSTTYKVSSTTWKITYGSGSASGNLVQDTLTFAGMTTPPVSFGTASTLSSSFTSLSSDGILGLGSQSASVQNVPTFLDNLVSAGLLQRKLFSVNLQRANDTTDPSNAKEGELTFGAIDTSKFAGLLVSLPNIAQSGLWEAAIDGFSVSGQTIDIGTSASGIIDTGTTLVLAPPTMAKAIHAAIPGAMMESTDSGSFSIPCTTKVSLSMTFGGTEFAIDPRDYVGDPIDDSKSQCLSNISGQQVGTDSQFLLGDVFLKNVYTVFDAESNAIGFGSKDVSNSRTESLSISNIAKMLSDMVMGS